MRSVQVTDAQRDLPQLLDSVAAGEEIIITRDNRAVAKLVGSAEPTSLRDIQASSVGSIIADLSPDDDLLGEMLDR